jgi:hypothetical protein
MVDVKLVNYIRASLSRKVPIEQTKKALLAKGWKDSDINEAIRLANQGQAQTSKQPFRKFFQNQKQTPKQSVGKIQKQPARKVQPQQFQRTAQRPVQMTQKPIQEKSGTGKFKLSKKLIFIIAGVFALILIGIVIFFVMKGSSSISEAELSAGASLVMGANKETKFNLNEEEHTLTIDSVSATSVGITVMSTPMSATLSIGETEKFDFEGDKVYDLAVTLNGITDEEAEIYLKKISEACVEDWQCTEWGNCTDGIQTRVCEDLNDCGTEENKPDESQECESEPALNCSDYDGTDIDCFIDFAGTCEPSNLTYDFTMNIVGWMQTNSYYYEITGYAGGKCELYEKVLSSSGEYSDAKKQSLLDEGNTEEEITEMEDEKNDELAEFVDKYGTCRYSTSQLKEMLNELKELGVELPISNYEVYECEGPLYEMNMTNSTA